MNDWKSLLVLGGLVSLPLVNIAEAQDDPTAPPATEVESAAKPQTLKERAGFAWGTVIGREMKETGIEIDVDQFARALAAALGGEKSILSEAELKLTFDEALKAAEKRKQEAGTRWLAENKTKEGIRTTQSGLQYEILEPGEGESPKPPQRAKVHYTGTLTDGTKFDSSREGDPFTFSLNGGVIPGWIEAVQLMKPGARYRFFIPHELGYGQQGSRGAIPPYAALIFDIELLEILPPAR